MLPPITFPDDWTEADYRTIAGFILYFRAGMLQALRSVSDPAAAAIPEWQDRSRQYYEDAESVTRWLLSFTPYAVQKNQLWDPRDPANFTLPVSAGSLAERVLEAEARLGDSADS